MKQSKTEEIWAFFQDMKENGKWKWKLIDLNGQVHVSARSYDSRERCEENARHHGYVKLEDR